MLQGEHSAILSTFIKLPFSIKTCVLSIFKWPLKTGFTVTDSLTTALCGLAPKLVVCYSCDFDLRAMILQYHLSLTAT